MAIKERNDGTESGFDCWMEHEKIIVRGHHDKDTAAKMIIKKYPGLDLDFDSVCKHINLERRHYEHVKRYDWVLDV